MGKVSWKALNKKINKYTYLIKQNIFKTSKIRNFLKVKKALPKVKLLLLFYLKISLTKQKENFF